jgi:hypothetical protein
VISNPLSLNSNIESNEKEKEIEPNREVTLWPSKENYARFKVVCDDTIPDTFEEFEALASERLEIIKNTHGIVIEKLAFDPDRMALWCRENCGRIDANARSIYAGVLSLSN